MRLTCGVCMKSTKVGFDAFEGCEGRDYSRRVEVGLGEGNLLGGTGKRGVVGRHDDWAGDRYTASRGIETECDEMR